MSFITLLKLNGTDDVLVTLEIIPLGASASDKPTFDPLFQELAHHIAMSGADGSGWSSRVTGMETLVGTIQFELNPDHNYFNNSQRRYLDLLKATFNTTLLTDAIIKFNYNWNRPFELEIDFDFESSKDLYHLLAAFGIPLPN